MIATKRTTHEISQHIIKTAHELFERYGVNNVSMHQVAISSGIGQGTLYRRFANKAELCSALIQEDLDQFKVKVDVATDPLVYNTPRERLENFLYRWLDFLDREYEMIDVMRLELTTPGRINDHVESSPFFGYLKSKLSELLNDVAKDNPNFDINIDFLVFMMVSSINSSLYCHFKNNDGYTLEEIHANLCRLCIYPLFV